MSELGFVQGFPAQACGVKSLICHTMILGKKMERLAQSVLQIIGFDVFNQQTGHIAHT